MFGPWGHFHMKLKSAFKEDTARAEVEIQGIYRNRAIPALPNIRTRAAGHEEALDMIDWEILVGEREERAAARRKMQP